MALEKGHIFVFQKLKVLLKILKFILFNLSDFSVWIFTRRPSPQALASIKDEGIGKRKLLLVSLGAIGDYLLLRNFISHIKDSERFSAHSLTLCGNVLWKDLALDLDGREIDDFIWVHPKKFHDHPLYRFRLLMAVRKADFDVILSPTTSRSYLADVLVLISGANRRIGCHSDLVNIDAWKRSISDHFYTEKIGIPLQDSFLFEFEKNRRFFVQVLGEGGQLKLLGQKLILEREKLPPAKLLPADCHWVLFFPGAGDEGRRWPLKNFSQTIKFILEGRESSSPRLRVGIAGGKGDRTLAAEIIQGLTPTLQARVSDFCGRWSLTETAAAMTMAEFVLTNESMAAHMAKATGTPYYCISNGNHYLRFHPYPERLGGQADRQGVYIYPRAMREELEGGDLTHSTREEIYQKYLYGSKFHVDSVSVADVLAAIGNHSS